MKKKLITCGSIKELRETFDYKQKEIAALLGCSQSLVSKYESGLMAPTLPVLKSLAGLGVDVHYFVKNYNYTPKMKRA